MTPTGDNNNNTPTNNIALLLEDVARQLMRDKFVFVPAAAAAATVWQHVVGKPGHNHDNDNDDAVAAAAAAAFLSMAEFWEETAPQQNEHGQTVYPGKSSLCAYYRSDISAPGW